MEKNKTRNNGSKPAGRKQPRKSWKGQWQKHKSEYAIDPWGVAIRSLKNDGILHE